MYALCFLSLFISGHLSCFPAFPQHAVWYVWVFFVSKFCWKWRSVEVYNHSCCSLRCLGTEVEVPFQVADTFQHFVAPWTFLDQACSLKIKFAWLQQASPNDKIITMLVLSRLTFDICQIWNTAFLSKLSMCDCFL